VDAFGDSGIEIKILGDTKPIRQWDVMGELRLRLKKAFDEESIEIPWPHMKVYFGNWPRKK
jgi:small conductance mechanosensitive channel